MDFIAETRDFTFCYHAKFKEVDFFHSSSHSPGGIFAIVVWLLVQILSFAREDQPKTEEYLVNERSS